MSHPEQPGTTRSTHAAWLLLLRRAAWAPAAVLLLHRAVVWADVRDQADHLVHGSGGAAAAYFAVRWCQVFGPRLGCAQPWLHLLAAFLAACTAGVMVELVEFGSDVFLGTAIQITIRETMLDLVADVVGALVALAVLAWPRTRLEH